jgi:malate dehydrogenase (oxaloacetate-decarboxylating)
MQGAPSPGYSFTLRVEIKNQVGMLGKVTSAIGEAGGDIGALDLISATRETVVRDITVNAIDLHHREQIIRQVQSIPQVKVISVSDRTFLLHLGGKIEVRGKFPLKTRADLSQAYTPGVARVCKAIAENPSDVHHLTIKKNCVAVISDGSAVLGLGDIGPEAALPILEGKAMLFKEFGGVDAFPISLKTKDPEIIISTILAISPVFGGINLEDISSPRCMQIERRLQDLLDIPVFHDDQHGTAIVVLAALINALKIVKKKIQDIKVVVSGIGAAGSACCWMLLEQGIKEIIACDRAGALYGGRKENMNPEKTALAQKTNPRKLSGSLSDIIKGADLFLGLSRPGILKLADVQKMAKNPIVFALANPDPEIQPEAIGGIARIVATGRSDYPNQINNVLCFPGIFRGALDARATIINREMKVAAAMAIADCISPNELGEDYIVPSIFNRKVSEQVAKKVAEAAERTKVARRIPRHYIKGRA